LEWQKIYGLCRAAATENGCSALPALSLRDPVT